jgi:hypothetical protein
MIMRKRALLLPLLLLTLCLAIGLSGCSNSGGATTTTAASVSTVTTGAATPVQGAWHRIAAVKADGTPYTDDELAANRGDIVFGDGTFTEDWPEDTYLGTYTYADGVITVTYASDGDTQTLTLKDDGTLSYTYEFAGSPWDGETSTYSSVAPVSGQ